MKHYGDITKLSGYDLPVVDVITGGSPCQDLSVAGKRAGLAGERSGLFMEQIRLVKEMRENDRNSGRTGFLIRPRYMVWENVPGAFSSNGGKDFQAVLEEIVKIVEAEVPDLSGAVQGGWTKSGCLYSDMGHWSIAWRVHDAQFWGVPQRRKRIALVADFGGLSAPEILFERKGLSGDFEPCGTAGKGTAAGTESGTDRTICLQGNGIDRTDTAGCDGRGWREDVSYTLNTIDRPAVCSVHRNASGEVREGTVAYTLGTNANASGRNTPMVYENHSQDSRYKPLGDVSETVSAKYGTGGNNQPLVVGDVLPLSCMHDQQAVITSVVRRLTPMECERLQGFPDNWSKHGVDENGKVYELSDSARYRLQGNSIARPFWTWMLRRIAAQYERPATLGSLFDGQAGFPLCWSEVGGIPVWSSEIEKHAQAVARYHFPEEET